jgi:hypothetical protein
MGEVVVYACFGKGYWRFGFIGNPIHILIGARRFGLLLRRHHLA